MNADPKAIVEVKWRRRDSDGEKCSGCGDICFLGNVHRSYIEVIGDGRPWRMPFTLCPECFEEYQKLDQ